MLSLLRSLFGNDRPVARPARHQFRPQLSPLDDRIVPAVNVSATNGLLTIRGIPGQPRGEVFVDLGVYGEGGFTQFDEIPVFENGVRLTYPWDGQPFRDVLINLDTPVVGNNYVFDTLPDVVKLRSLSVSGWVDVRTGGGNDRVEFIGVEGFGDSSGLWRFSGGAGTDELTFRNAPVHGPVDPSQFESVRLHTDTWSQSTRLDEVVFWGNPTGGAASELVVSGRSRVTGDVRMYGSEISLHNYGTVGGNVSVNNATSNVSGYTSWTTVYPGGQVQGNLTVGRSDFLAGQATVSVEGRVNGNLTVYGSSAGDVVLVNTGATVGGNVTVNTGGGNDYVFVYGAIGANTGSQSANIRTGEGNDWVEVGSSARADSFICQLEGGNDTFILRTGAVFLSMLATGGAGTDSFYGVRTLPNLWLGTFEVFG